MNDETWMKNALELGQQAAQIGEVPIGAILVSDGKIIGSGYNQRETSTRTCAHAEVQAIDDYNKNYQSWRLPKDSSIYVTTEPCLMCTGALLWARVDHLYYGCEDPKNAGLRVVNELIESGRFDHRFKTVQGNVLGEECAKALKEFFSLRRAGKLPSFSDTQ